MQPKTKDTNPITIPDLSFNLFISFSKKKNATTNSKTDQ